MGSENERFISSDDKRPVNSMGSPPPSNTIRMTAEQKKKRKEAWETAQGYETTSGCPCIDHTNNLCIPKGRGWGYNINCWFLFCCCLCDEKRAEDDPGEVC
uniref:Uncharacterized protein n=1 Tax=Paramoeba aestuarina TaxID=180227 RepID=A0A7S4NAB3_9EUKA|mmetsp:Transcript_13270/g.20468  ORF Transcript_13270/g.20468 Transcript_13270/m.20468 type:complete len:101 (+) Transcript_13270:506-808(+)